MDVIKAIHTRRSIRRFDRSTGTVSEVNLKEILAAGFQAPSAHNLQPRHFIVLRDPETLDKVAAIGRYTKMASQADLCIVVVGDTSTQPIHDLLVMDCAAAIENMLLTVHGLGYGGVWCAAFEGAGFVDMPALASLLELPETMKPQGFVMIGLPDEERAEIDRYNPSSVHWEKW